MIQEFFDSLRPSIESILLAEYITLLPGDRILDTGCGTGYLTLRLAHRFPCVKMIVGIDIQSVLIKEADKNLAALTSLTGNLAEVSFVERDAAVAQPLGVSYNALVSNPPFFTSGASRPAPEEKRRLARQDETLSPETLFACAEYHLSHDGRLYLVYPYRRLSEIERAAEHYGFILTNIRHHPEIRKRSGGICLITALKTTHS